MTEALALDLPDGYSLVAFEEIGSTNDEARRLAESGSAHGTVVTARRQTAGRGRRGRTWVSPEGNLHISVVVRPNVEAERASQLSFVAALAAGETMQDFIPGGVTLRYKWPNDVLLNGAKASGLLLETASVAQGLIGWVVVGVGINIAHFPEDVPYPATSLHAQGAHGANVDAVIPRFVGHLADWYDRWRDHGFEPVRDAWLARAAGLGEEIEVRLSSQTIRGRFDRLDRDGALILALAGGETRRITSGDVFFV